MPRALVNQFSWGGLNTKAQETGLPLLECVHLQDMRLVGRDLVERYGIVHVEQFSGNLAAVEGNGQDSYFSCPVDSRVWAPGTNWTLEVCFASDLLATNMGLLYVGTTTPAMALDCNSGDIRFRVWDTDDTLDTITVGSVDNTATQTVQITRDGATLSARLDNGTPTTATMHATNAVRTPVGNLYVMYDGSNFYDGTLDYVRLYSISRDSHNDRLIRNPCPRASHVLADYTAQSGDTDFFYDRSRYGNHMEDKGTVAVATTLCHNPAPIRALGMTVDAEGRKQLLVCAGGKYYIAEVG